MAQTTGAITLAAQKVEISTSGFPTSAIDISGITTEIAVAGGDMTIVKAFTFGTATPIIAAGNLDTLKVTVNAIYSENTGDQYSVLESAYLNKTAIAVRYSPKGGSTGNFRFTSANGYVTTHPYPSGNAEGTDFAMFSVTFEVPSITRTTI